MIKNRVKELRTEYHYSQQQLAQLVHVSRQTIVSIENSRSQPTLELSFKLAKVFHRTIEEVFLYEEN